MKNNIEKTIQYCISHIEKIKDLIDQYDPEGQASSLRVKTAYDLYCAIDDECKRAETIDHEGFTKKMRQIFESLNGLKNDATAPMDVQLKSEPQQDINQLTKDLYGKAWSVFDEQAFISAALLLEKRFKANGVDVALIKDADCLDFGCGSGRYCFGMLKLGAKSVHGVDFSPENIELAEKRINKLISNPPIKLEEGDITKVFGHVFNKYDFIVSQGIVHCLEKPFDALRILHRVLRPDGSLYLFVYGDNGQGIYWKLVDLIRHILNPVEVEKAVAIMGTLNAAPNRIYTILDVGYTHYQYRYNRDSFEKVLSDIGFKVNKTMKCGEIYETNERIRRFPWEKEFWGNEELRYILTKQ